MTYNNLFTSQCMFQNPYLQLCKSSWNLVARSIYIILPAKVSNPRTRYWTANLDYKFTTAECSKSHITCAKVLLKSPSMTHCHSIIEHNSIYVVLFYSLIKYNVVIWSWTYGCSSGQWVICVGSRHSYCRLPVPLYVLS